MKVLRFDWDPNKNAINLKKHGVGFEEAKTCFEDDYAEIFEDVEHSVSEERSILSGMSSLLKTLVVVYTERIHNEELSLPISPVMTIEEARIVVELINRF